MKKLISTTAVAALIASGAAFAEQHTSAADAEQPAEQTETMSTEENMESEEEMSSEEEMETEEEMSSEEETQAGEQMSSDTGSTMSQASGDSPFGEYEDTEQLEIFATDFIGKRIYSSEMEVGDTVMSAAEQEWNDLGEVNDLLLGARDGRIDYAILGIGGFLGIGERDILVRMDQIQIVRDGDDATDYFLVINATQEQIENAPEFDSTMVNEAENAANEAAQATENAAEATGQAVENTAEQTGDAVENAAEETGQAVDNAAEETGQAVDNAAEETEQEVENAVEEAGDAAEDAGEEVEEQTNN